MENTVINRNSILIHIISLAIITVSCADNTSDPTNADSEYFWLTSGSYKMNVGSEIIIDIKADNESGAILTVPRLDHKKIKLEAYKSGESWTYEEEDCSIELSVQGEKLVQIGQAGSCAKTGFPQDDLFSLEGQYTKIKNDDSVSNLPKLSNPFDQFLGKYKVQKVDITEYKEGDCNAYDHGVDNAFTLEVEKDDREGFTHEITAFSPELIYGDSIFIDETVKNPNDNSVITENKTTGKYGFANFEMVNYRNTGPERSMWTFEKYGKKVIYKISLEEFPKNSPLKTCSRTVYLEKAD